MGQKTKWLGDDSWQSVAAVSFLHTVGIKPLKTYIDKRYATVSEWVVLLTIFEVCVKETGCEEGL